MAFAMISLAGSGMAQEKKKVKKKNKTETITCWVSMDCEGCKAKVEKNIAYEKGVKDLKVDLDTKLVTITYRSDKTNPEKLEKAIQKLGYKTEMISSKKKEKDGKKVKEKKKSKINS